MRSAPDGWMTGERQKRPKCVLRNGDTLDARTTVVLYEYLVAMQHVHPRTFESLLAIAQDRASEALPADVQVLKEEGMLDETGKIDRDVRSVLLSPYRTSADGPVLASPVRANSVRDELAIQQAYKEIGRTARDVLNERDDDGPSLN